MDPVSSGTSISRRYPPPPYPFPHRWHAVSQEQRNGNKKWLVPLGHMPPCRSSVSPPVPPLPSTRAPLPADNIPKQEKNGLNSPMSCNHLPTTVPSNECAGKNFSSVPYRAESEEEVLVINDAWADRLASTMKRIKKKKKKRRGNM
mmetsp:Transcript_4023/g.6237  ORF Transcript_4023/g.6237 Transcript_4023/m.6237 type:complete len:146 (+) Transcript_4023:147-584(+)